ncbi:MAG: hypothetical protein J6Q39_00505 [Bacteroidales bacterium]|nr:hypothetical protein [Bacteroidales bacterium]
MATLYNVDQRPGESMEQWYKRLARAADDRLRALEAYQHDKYFKPAIQWAYSVAQHDIQKWSGQHANRFNTKPPEKPEELLAKISDIQKFLVSPTSTKSGIRASYQKRADSINKKYPGVNFSWKDMAQFFESGTWQALDTEFGSKTAMKIVAQIRKYGKREAEKLKARIEEAKEQNQKIEEKKLIDRNVNKALSDNNVSIEDLFI